MAGIEDIIAAAVSSTLPAGVLSRILVLPAADSDGLDAWAVTVVLTSEDVAIDHAVQTIFAVQEAFEGLGDERIPIVDFATEDELRADVGSEA